ncbi:uncharacterized protein FMAN_07647 [Fusarium mangiferae]|uniref:Uncharacterized protein n=1 Tax=Fusarium mangiferae TaxID=192010 RepID=A0A1L7TB49_FUSMA|nr:uncharacterized protein FMAN_07647 [Fusarium mangiferae]CVK92815.1 uncharacterized protein FMAN_07647 [Fusarium mangiferae]
MVLSRLRCLDGHILANALIWFPIEAAHWLLGRGGAQSRHHIRRHAVDGRIKICGWLGRHSSLFEAGVVQSPAMFTVLKLKFSWARSGVASGVVASAAARANGAPIFSTQPCRREGAR